MSTEEQGGCIDSAKKDEVKNGKQGKKKRTHRKLSEISDEELRAATGEAKNFPELKRMLGINPNEKNERLKSVPRRLDVKGC